MKSKTKTSSAKKTATKTAAKKTASTNAPLSAGTGKAANRAKSGKEGERPQVAPGILCGFRGYKSTEGIPADQLVFEKGNRLLVLEAAKDAKGKAIKGQWECQLEGSETYGVVLEDELRVLKQPKPQEPEFEEVENTAAVAKALKNKESTAAAEDMVHEIDRNEFTLGGLIHEIRRTKSYERITDDKGRKVYEGSEGFARYCEQRLRMGVRSAYGLADVYVTARVVGITEEEVSAVGATKMLEIARVATLKNKDRLLKYAAEHTVVELKGYIKTLKEKGDVSERGAGAKNRGGRNITAFNFVVPGDQAEFIKQSLETMKDRIREDGKEEPSDSVAFAAIFTEWTATQEGADISMENFNEMVKARFPGFSIAADAPASEEAAAPVKGKKGKK